MVSILFRMLCGWMIGTIVSLYIHELGHVMVGIANGCYELVWHRCHGTSWT